MRTHADAVPLDPYVPRLAAEWELDAPGARWRALDATCCFVDISGFTALSERLARRGRIGAEELTEVLNHVFSRMLAVAYDRGGSLLKFGGDALLFAFTGDDHPTLAAHAAVAMRAALREARTLPTSVGRLTLRMSVGLHSGTVHLFRVGGSHHELIVSGPAATGTTDMERIADAGEIVVSSATAARLPAAATGAAKGAGRLLRWRRVAGVGPGPTPPRAVAREDVEASVPVALRARLAERAVGSEHRMSSVAFVKFQGVDDLLASEGPDATAEAIGHVVEAVQRAADDEGVTFLASDIDANGGKIILTTGVPAAQDDDEGRVLRAARSIASQLLPLPVRVGVHRGHVFAGDIGTEFRRTFTIIGDTVNLAARLMARADPGQVLATGSVLERSRTRFLSRALPPFAAKGKSELVRAYDVGAAHGVNSGDEDALPFKGRDKELALLADALAATHGGRGGVALVEAERGAGKTRLVKELAASTEIRTITLQGEPYGGGLPYLPLRDAIREVLGIDATDRREAGSQLDAAMRAVEAELAPLAPLLAPLVDATLSSTRESSAVADEFGRDRVAELVISILEHTCPGPLLVVAEDTHWFDDTSGAVLNRIAGATRFRPWLLCATRRTPGGSFDPAVVDVPIQLGPLADEAVRDVVETSTVSTPVRPHERDQIVARAGGNPMFLDELLRVMQSADVDSLPESLDAVMMREIDTLPGAARHVLRLASVLGRSFDTALLRQFLAGEQIDVADDLLDGLDRQLVPDGDGRLRFRHALLQETAYQSLPFRSRLALHRRAGLVIESAAGDGEDMAPILSLHFLEARDWERTWQYARRAAHGARQAHALAEAATHLDRSVTAARHLEHVGDHEVASLLTELGETLLVLGTYEEADDAYRRALQASKHDPLGRARIAERRAHLRSYQGRLPAAIRQIRTGAAMLDGLPSGDIHIERTRATLLAREAELRSLQGRLNDAIGRCEVAIREAERVGELPALALALGVLDICFIQLGRPEDATHLGRTIELYEQLNDQVNVAATLSCLGAVAYYAAKWDDAVDYYTRASDAATAAGDFAHAAIAQANLGEIRLNQGRLPDAVALLTPAQRTLESFGFREAAGWALMQLGRARAFAGELRSGLAMIRSAAEAFDDIESLVASVEARARSAEVLAFGGEIVAATAAVAEARTLERRLGETPLAALLDRVEVTLAVESGDPARATSLLPGCLERARRLGAPYDALVALTIAAHLGVGEGDGERARLARDLGIVDLVMLEPLSAPAGRSGQASLALSR